MGLLDWLWKKKETPAESAQTAPAVRSPDPIARSPRIEPPAPAPRPEQPAPTPRVAPPPPAPRAEPPRQPSPADNLRRWCEAGQARLWVASHKGQWNHEEWLALLASLRTTAYWPMEPTAIGEALEAAKRDWWKMEGGR